MTNEEFSKLYGRLNDGQKQAVDAVEGSVMVIAGPGTGKTQILTLRIANILLNTQVNPENILALTYTESGVYAMRKRLVDIIGTPGYRVGLYTFHGFCNELIKNNQDEFPHLIASENATELEQIQIVEDFITTETFEYLKPMGEPMYYVKPILSAISELKKEGISVEQFAEAVTQKEIDFWKIADLYHEKGASKGKMKVVHDKKLKNILKNKELIKVYAHYQDSLIVRKLYDFHDMLLEVIKVLGSNDQFLLHLQEQCQYLLIDEHQDTNTAQNRIVELLCNYYENPNLFVVGDEKQSIYRFQGASLENFLYFKKLYPHATLINLQDNYRSCQTILDASGSIIANNKITNILLSENAGLFAKSNHPEERIRVIASNDYYSEYYCIAEEIQKKIKDGIIPSEIAILAKENKDLNQFVPIFQELKIPFTIEAPQNILQDLEIQKLLLLFSAITQFGTDDTLIKAMHIDCLHINPIDIYKLHDFAKQNIVSVWEVLDSEESLKELKLKSLDEIKLFHTLLLHWKTLSHNESFDHLFKSVLNESGFIKSVLAKRNAMQVIDNVTGLFEDIKVNIEKKSSFNLDDFMKYLDLIEQHKIKIPRSTKTIRKDAIRLMTAHKSKGLEFDHVYIINAYDGHWGNSRKRGNNFSIPWDYLIEKLNVIEDEEKNEDERRLFYVAVTRARKVVTITYSSFGKDGKERVPSQFINEILETYREIIDIESFEKDFLLNKHIILSSLAAPTSTEIANEYLANKDFFTEIFKRKGFSVSHLNNYLDCPWKYFFRNLIALPDTMGMSAIFGNLIHKSLDEYINTSNEKNKSFVFLFKSFTDALNRQSLTPQEKIALQARGKKALEGYYETYVKNWNGNLLGEFGVKGIKFSDNVTLTGRLDMIETNKDNNDVIVYDFKTGNPKSRNEIEGNTKTSDGNYKLQLVFYKILLDRYQFKKMNMTEGVIDFVEPNDSGQYKREFFTITPDEVKELEDQIQQVTTDIIAMKYWDQKCGTEDCEFCALRSYIG